ncbi:MAG TPA: hypothetical protein DIW31_04905 [Bacteroidales bacterium]|nr:hypothetical protein [Bacteroidales bacterium]
MSTGTYHAESRNLTTGCTSGTRTAVSVTIYAVVPSPSFPVAQSFCAGATVSSLASTPPSGSVTDWYSVSTGGTALAGTTVLTTGQYFAQSRSTSTGCVSVTRYPVNVTVNALPTVYAVTGGGTYCSGGAGVIVGLNGSQTGVNYQLKLGTGNVGSPVSGSGSGISFGNVTGAGTYTVLATNATTGCSNTMNGSAVVAINPLPTVYLIQGGGGFCTGESVVNVYMNSTVSGVKYELYKDGVNTGVNFYGNGYGQNFLTHTSAVGTYTAKGTITSTGCSIAMSGSVTVTEFLKPTPTLIASSNSICPGTSVTFTAGPGSGTAISTYDFKVNGVSKQIGTNNTFITNALVNNDVVTIESTTINGCKATSAGITITVNPLPNSYVVTGFSGYCSGGNGVAIGLNGSQVGVNYQLKLEGNSVGLPISGSGAALNFGNQMATGKYKVLGTNTSSGCFKEMGNDLTVSIYPLPTPTLSASKTTICQGDNVAFTAGTGSGVSITNYNFKINGVSKQNGSSATFSANTLLNNDLVTVEGTSTNGCKATSSPITIIVYNPITITTHPLDVSVSEGNSISFSIIATGTSLNYQWQASSDAGLTWNNIGENSSIYGISEVPLFMNGFKFRCTVKNEVCPSINSLAANLAVQNVQEISKIPFSAPNIDNKQNYVQEIILNKEISLTTLNDVLTGTNLSFNYEDLSCKINYFDGLGRPSQEVQYRTNPLGYDIIQPFAYDEYGRENKKYLPYSNGYSGVFHSNALKNNSSYLNSEQCTFYSSLSSAPFAETVFDSSPLNKVVEQGAPGESWQIQKDAIGTSTRLGHTQRLDYLTNTGATEVIFWKLNSSNQLIRNNYYGPGELYVLQTKDENGYITKEYKNKLGLVILKKTAVSTQDEAQTYYAYDEYNRLRFVLPPMMVQSLGTKDTLNSTDILVKNYGYYYLYDDNGRMIVKQFPGADPVYMVYDARNRLVLTQDGNMRNEHKWLFTKYDAINRPIITGIYTDLTNTTQELMQLAVNTFYGTNSVTNNIFFEVGGTDILGYTNRSFPILTNDLSCLTVAYYDNYSQCTSLNGFTGLTFDSNRKISTYVDNDGISNGYFDHIKGLTTGTKVKVLDGNEYTTNAKWMYGITYYDNIYRPIQSKGTIYDGTTSGVSTVSNKYRFNGLVDQILESQTLNGITTEYSSYFTYDQSGRLRKKEQQIVGDNDNSRVTIAEMTYNELGQLTDKKLHGGAQSVDYKYNIRGWLTQINDPTNLANDGTGDSADLFAMNLKYNDTDAELGTTAQFNGNISAMVWNTKDKAKSAYTFGYDGLNRLKVSDYKLSTGICSYAESAAYEEKDLTYDLNGNITHLFRSNNNGSLLNDFTYSYNGTNQLQSLSGSANFIYDKNGNMTTDGLKGFTVSYNMLNLPSSIAKGGESVSYIYNASGVKLAKLQNGNFQQFYNGNLVYNGSKQLDYLITSEGIIKANVATNGTVTYTYEYYLKDHLGNTRVVFDKNRNILQASDYYPFGSRFEPFNPESSNKYLYNGKELQNETIGGTTLGWYDYGARFYDPMLGRWTIIDNMSEKFLSTTPYGYAVNNPIALIDVDGNEWFYYSKDGKSDPTWNWRDEHEYKTGVKDVNGKELVLTGVEAVVVFEGFTKESLGPKSGHDKEGDKEKSNQYLDGVGTISAKVTVYGPDNKDDISVYKGYTSSSDPNSFGEVSDGFYKGKYVSPGKNGPLDSHWQVFTRTGSDKLPPRFGQNIAFPNRNPAFIDGIFIHSNNANGWTGTYMKNGVKHGISQGCFIIDYSQWADFNSQLSGVQNFTIQLVRNIHPLTAFDFMKKISPSNSK